MQSVPERAAAHETARRLVAEGRATDLADAYLAQIPEEDLDALAAAIARVLISSARNEGDQ